MLAVHLEGVVVVWQFWPDTYGHEQDLWAQRLKPDGTVLWGLDGVPLSAANRHQGFSALPAEIVSDGVGGAVAAWADARNGRCFIAEIGSNCDVFAQRVGIGSSGCVFGATSDTE